MADRTVVEIQAYGVSPDTIDEMVVLPDAAAALGRLRQRGFRLIVATNQPDIARKRLTRAQVDAMNAHLRGQLPLDTIEVCPHDDADNCDCRKPKPGLLVNAARRDGIALSESFMVGDRFRDIANWFIVTKRITVGSTGAPRPSTMPQ